MSSVQLSEAQPPVWNLPSSPVTSGKCSPEGRVGQLPASQSGGKSESAFDPPGLSAPPARPVTIWTVRAIAGLSQSHWLKTQPPLRWFPLLGCLRVSQSLAWVLSKHLGEGLAREPPSSWGPYGQGASQPARPPSSFLHPLLPAPLLPSSSSLHPFCGRRVVARLLSPSAQSTQF